MSSFQETISVIIPTRNRFYILNRTLHYLDRQEAAGRPFEVIVVDDGSADETVEAMSKAVFSYPFYYLQGKRSGPAAARNIGLNKASGETVLFLNDDCFAEPDLLAQHRIYRQKYGECTVLGHIAWSPEIILTSEIKQLVERYFSYEQITEHDKVGFSFFITGNLSAPLRLIKEAGGFDESFREAAFEDIELGYRLYRLGLPIFYNPRALSYHYHPLKFFDLCDRQQKIAYWFYFFLKKHPEAKKYYPNLDSLEKCFPITRENCLKLILYYVSHRGWKAGESRFCLDE